MSKSSVNLSDRLFFTVDYFDDSSYIGELEGKQNRLVSFTKEETAALKEALLLLVTKED